MSESLHLRFDAFELDEANALLTRDGRPVALPPKAFAVLCALARRGGRLITKEALLDAAWGHRHVSDSVLKSTISQLRGALDDDARQPRFIETASRHGYRFIGLAPASATAAAAPASVPQAPIGAADSIAAPAAVAGLVGRAAPLAQLQAAWARARAGQRQVCWLSGEAGVGKTTLLEAFAASLGAEARIAHGQCVQQFGAGEPYLPVLEALAALCRDNAELPALLRSVAPTWLLQLPWLSDAAERAALQRELAGVHPDRMLREFGELLDRFTAQRPLLLVTEDLHWSDQATVRLLDHVARRRGAARLMWLGSFRSAELIADEHPLKDLRHELRLHRLGDEIALEPFSEREVAEFLASRFPEPARGEALVRALHAHTDGLPLFLVNVADDWLRAEPNDAAGAAPRVPESLAGVIGRQIERLSAAQQALLGMAALIGVEFRAASVALALALDATDVAAVCDELVRRQTWLRALPLAARPDGTLVARYTFAHALYRHVFDQRQSEAARALGHRRIAAALEAEAAAGTPVPAVELATQHDLGHAPLAALRHYAEAAAHALARFAPREALRLTDRALVLLEACPDGVERLELELMVTARRGMACSILESFSSSEAKRSFERALALCEALPETTPRAWVHSGLGWVLYARAEYAAARALGLRLDAHANRSDDDALRVCACNLLGLTLAQQGDWAASRGWFDTGLALCERLGAALPLARFVIDPRVTMRALLALALYPLGAVEASLARRDEALALAAQSGQRTALLAALWAAGMIEQRLGATEQVLARGRALEALWLEQGVAGAEGPGRWLQGWAVARLGDPSAGHALIVEGLAAQRRTGRLAGITHVLSCAAGALMQAGDWAGAAATVDEGFAEALRLDERASLPDLHLQRGRIALADGRIDAARAALQASLAAARELQAPMLEAEPQAELDALDTRR